MYSNDKATQIVLSLLKAHGIRKVIASPGTTNIALVASMQADPWFEMYSSVDERSAAYIACGLASESGEAVVLTCTEATASRNYLSGLTEAYYRKLPILAITGTHGDLSVGHLTAQSLDRSVHPVDTVRVSYNINKINTPEEEWATIVRVNDAILSLHHHGGGPAHINLCQATRAGYTTKELPLVRVINRISVGDSLPELNKYNRIAVFIGAHQDFTDQETQLIEKFCLKYNAVVFCDHTSGYHGHFSCLGALMASQTNADFNELKPDLLIHLGEVSGEYYQTRRIKYGKDTWRVSPDGAIRDLFKNLTKVFEMTISQFFSAYVEICDTQAECSSYYEDCENIYRGLIENFPEIPFCNIWAAKKMSNLIPDNSVVHFSILNSLRSWNFFRLPANITSRCNVGGFGIDGPISTLLGASLAQPDKLHFGIVGDLSFFYDLNTLGNRHVGNNIRILLVNNGVGTEFRNYDHPASKWGEDANRYMAAGGHFGNKSIDIVKAYSTALNFEYLCASNKEEFETAVSRFLDSSHHDRPILFEIFTTPENESKALKLVHNIVKDNSAFLSKLYNKACGKIKSSINNTAKKLIK